jgi:8-oxo-dGTP pyrophosphatase MutT (NUDIX family)
MKELSCGIIIINSENKILGCRAYGKDKIQLAYDIPKGKINIEETTYQAAIRETIEETSLDLSDIEIKDLGHFTYNSKKDLHLFKCYYNIKDLSKLHCDSMFTDNFGNICPEVVGYKWIDFSEINTHFYLSLGKILNTILK